jgi:hypothetical protein
MITEDTPCWWHGCWLTAGHFLFARHGRSASNQGDGPFKGMTSGLDTGYAPRRHKRTGAICYLYQCGGFDKARSDLFYASEELPQGQFLRHYIGRDVTFLAWWDRAQGDTRGNCNSVYAVQGEHTTAEMLEWFPKLFPAQAACIERGGPEDSKPRDMTEPYKLVEVFVSPTMVFVLRCTKCHKVVHQTRYPSAGTSSLSPHRGPDWVPSSPDYCRGSGERVAWEPTEMG